MFNRTIPMTFNSGFICATVFYAVHLIAFGLAQAGFDRWLADALQLPGQAWNMVANSGPPFMQGLLFGEIACLSLWLNISDGKSSTRLSIYGWFALQALMFIVFSRELLEFRYALQAIFFGLGLVMVMPLCTLLPLRLCRDPIRLFDSTRAEESTNPARPTIAHAIYAILVIALMLGVPKMIAGNSLVTLGAMCVVWSTVVGGSTFVGLLIEINIRNRVLQILLSLLTAGFISAIFGFSKSSLRQGEQIFTLMICPSLLPLIGVWLFKRFGYSIGAQARTSVTESHPHPLMELDERSDND